MTQYFDEVGYLLRHTDALREVDGQVVEEMGLCVMSTGFPRGIRDRVIGVLLRYSGVLEWGGERGVKEPEYEDEGEYREGLSAMVSELHDLFHELRGLKVGLFTDDPRAWRRAILADFRDLVGEVSRG